jgi:epsilon-lactone hydrolase
VGAATHSPDATVDDAPPFIDAEAMDALMVVDQVQRAGRNWAGTRETTDPMVSPLFGDLSGLPPITVLQGTNDLLLPDVLVFVDGAREQGAGVELELVEGAFHAYIGVETPSHAVPWT